MFLGASHLIFQRATLLRNNMTPAEDLLWQYLKSNTWGLKFRRQHPILRYVADFYCHKLKLIIEVDGGIHDNKEVKVLDEERTLHLKENGIEIIRFKNENVLNNLEQVLDKIEEKAKELSVNMIDKISKENQAKVSPSGVRGEREPLFIIKIGGNVIDNKDALNSFLQDFAKIDGKKILIHGGGKIATKIGDELGIESKYINGRRITDDNTIDLVTMVYGGLVNKKIVAQLQSLQCNAIGLCGADANIIPAQKRPIVPISSGEGRGGTLDYGWVGDITNEKLEIKNLKLLLDAGLVPVFAPLTHDGNGHILNTNADTIASSLAVALSRYYNVRLIYCFEKKGVLENIDDDNSVIKQINKETYAALVAEKKLFEGILPKIDNAFAAIDAGVKQVLIGDAKDLIQNTTEETEGTLISP